MTLCKLSVSNMKKSVKDYAIYFFTLVLGVAIFYVFGAIETQTAMLRISGDMRGVMKLMTQIIDGVSVFIAFVLGFLIIYASRFLMKRRNREFGMYLLLGMGRRRVSLMLFIETLLIGVVSLVVGSLLGIGISQLTSALVANMFAADMTAYSFVFSGSALAKTCLYFGIIYVVVIVFNTVLIGRCRLIDMFQSKRRTEKVRMRNPWLSLFVFAMSIAGLVCDYYQVVCHFSDMYGKDIYICIGIGSVCTFLFFWSVSGMLLRVASSVKSLYYRGLNTFVIRQLGSRINTNIVSISIICLMLFFTICVLTSALAIKDTFNTDLEKYCTADLYVLNLTDGSDGDSVQKIFDKYGFKSDDTFSDCVTVYKYVSDDLTIYDSLGDTYFHMFYGSDRSNIDAADEVIMTVSDYNKLASLYGHDAIELAEGEYAVVANYSEIVTMRNARLESGAEICVFGVTLTPASDKCVDGNIELATQALETGTFIVPDSVVSGVKPSYELFAADYNTDDTIETDSINAEIKSICEDYVSSREDSGVDAYMEVNTKAEIAAAGVGIGAIASFVGLYIGLIFLISGAAILALKELSESADNAGRYRILSKLGADRRMINRALLRQMGLFFMFPLALAVVHSIFGMICSRQILAVMGAFRIAPSLIVTAVFIVLIYGGYFLITYLSGRKIINEEN